MRLHLNKTLRAALIAAITAVGFTLPQSFAETVTGAFQFTRTNSGHVVSLVSEDLTPLTFAWSESGSGSANAGTMADGTAVSLTWSAGKPGNWQGAAWANDAALASLNSDAGISLTSAQVSNLQSIGPGAEVATPMSSLPSRMAPLGSRARSTCSRPPATSPPTVLAFPA